MLSSLSNPLLPLAFASAVLIAQLWVLIAAGGAKGAFEAFVTSVPFQARVTRSSGLEGPCMALFLTEGPPSRGASLLELGLLPQPTPHQRCKPRLSRVYHTVGPCCRPRCTRGSCSLLRSPRCVCAGWGLVPNAHLEMVDSIDNMMGARSWLWTFIVFTMLINMLQLAGAVFATSAMDPQRMIKIYGGLSTAGLNTIVNSAVLCSMFGIYYDVELGLPLVNYVPGWAYLNVFMIMVATVTMIRSGDPAALLAAGVLGFYLFFWIVLPFIFG